MDQRFGFFRRRLPSVLLPLLFVASVAGAFCAGYYIARHDTTKREAARHAFFQASTSADQLAFYASLLKQVRAGNTEGTIRILQFQAHAQVEGAIQCLANDVCTQLMAPTAEKQAELRELISTYGTPLSK
jgi:hypothetical protein